MDLEFVAITLVLIAAATPLAWLVRRRSTRTIGILAIGGWVAAAFALPHVAREYRSAERAPAEQDVSYRPIEVPHEGFVGSRECRACHPSQYESWHVSYHRTMTQVADRETVAAPIDGEPVVLEGATYRLRWRGRELRVDIPDPDWAGAPGPRIEAPIVQITGSHHMQAYWYATGDSRKLGLFPLIWLIGDQRWIPRGSAFVQPPEDPARSERGRWNDTCIRCHSTNGRPRFDWDPSKDWDRTGNPADTQVTEFGIACEACHGPGEEHVIANRDPLRRYERHFTDGPDESTVQPANLEDHLSSQVCGQCHGIFAFHSDQLHQIPDWNRNGYAYRPGSDLNARRFMVQPRRNLESRTLQQILTVRPGYLKETHWSDGMVRVSGREYSAMIDSPCYAHGDESKGIMSCFSCHQMHPEGSDASELLAWADDQLKTGMRTDAACLPCHEKYRDPKILTAHTHHQAGSSGSLCYNCHMPFTSYGLLKAMRSHTLDSPTVEASLATGRPNACSQCHLDRPLAWTADHLAKWYDLPRPSLAVEQVLLADSVSWALMGDPGQRALAAWSMGWDDALAASGGGKWVVPYLVKLMLDPYDAVRYIAHRSLRRQPGFEDLEFDFVGPSDLRYAIARQTYDSWVAAGGSPELTGDRILIHPDGTFDMVRSKSLGRRRDDRPMLLGE